LKRKLKIFKSDINKELIMLNNQKRSFKDFKRKLNFFKKWKIIGPENNIKLNLMIKQLCFKAYMQKDWLISDN